MNSRRCQANRRQAPGRHTRADILRQLELQRGKCFWCDCTLVVYHVDHFVPLSRGGSNGPENLVITCPHCNLCKHNKLPEEFLLVLITALDGTGNEM